MADYFFLVLSKVIQLLIMILRSMNKKFIIKGILTVLKYVVTLALGYLGGSNDVISTMM